MGNASGAESNRPASTGQKSLGTPSQPAAATSSGVSIARGS